MGHLLSQLLANQAVASALYVLFGAAYLMPARINRCFDLTPGAAATLGAYVGVLGGASLGACLAVGSLTGAVVGGVNQWGVMSPLRGRGRSGSQLFLVSLGVVVVVESGVRMWRGSSAQMMLGGQGVFEIWGARMTEAQGVAVLGAALVWIGLFAAARWSPGGRLYRAVAEDRELALGLGLSVGGVEPLVGAVAGAVAGLGGVLLAAQIGATPSLGFNAILYGVIAGVISQGRLRAVLGVGVLMGATEGLVGWYLGSLWKQGVVFGLFLLYLLIRDVRMEREAVA